VRRRAESFGITNLSNFGGRGHLPRQRVLPLYVELVSGPVGCGDLGVPNIVVARYVAYQSRELSPRTHCEAARMFSPARVHQHRTFFKVLPSSTGFSLNPKLHTQHWRTQQVAEMSVTQRNCADPEPSDLLCRVWSQKAYSVVQERASNAVL